MVATAGEGWFVEDIADEAEPYPVYVVREGPIVGVAGGEEALESLLMRTAKPWAEKHFRSRKSGVKVRRTFSVYGLVPRAAAQKMSAVHFTVQAVADRRKRIVILRRLPEKGGR